MKRHTLDRMIKLSCPVWMSADTRDTLVAAVKDIDRIAFGAFEIASDDGTSCGCPATLAGYFNVKEEAWAPDVPEGVAQFAHQFDNRMRNLWRLGFFTKDEIDTSGHAGYIKVTD